MKSDMNKLERVLAELPEAMRAELEDFWLERERLRSPKSQLTYAFMALSLARTTGLRSFRELDREHFRKWHRWLRANMSESSRALYITLLKAVIRWLNEGELPRWLAELKVPRPRPEELIREKLIEPEELERLLTYARHPRDKAIISILYETGVRIGELLSLRLRDVEALEDGTYRLLVRGKTGVRPIRVKWAAPALRDYLSVRRGPKHPGAPVFTTIKGPVRPLRPDSWRVWLRKLCKIAGLERHIHPHMFRHTAMTELARVLTEQELKAVAGWTQSSRMAAVYVHLSGRDIEAALDKATAARFRLR